MIRAFFLFICLVLSILPLEAAANVDHVKEEVSVTVPMVKLSPLTLTRPATVQKRPVIIANQASAVSANLRKKEDIEVDLEDVTPFTHAGPYQVQLTFNYPDIYTVHFNDGVATIGPSVEYPAAYYGYYSVNLRLRKMIITIIYPANWFNDAEFLGPVVTSLTSGANLPQPAYVVSSTAANPGILTSTSTTIALNWKGVSFNQGDVIVIGW